MIGTWISRSRYKLPFGRDASARLLPWIIALMVYLSALGGVGLILLADTLRGWDQSLASAMTLQVPAETSAARMETTLATLRQTAGVVSVNELTADETARLVQPWLGPSVSIASLPLPHLIDIRVDPDATIDFVALRKHLAAIAPGARLDENRSALDRLQHFGVQIQGLIGGGMAVVAVLLVLTVVLTARTGLAIHRPMVEILHLLGAPDRYIAQQFQTHALWLGLRGGIIGALAAAATVVAVVQSGAAASLPLPVASAGLADWRPWGLLVAAALAAGLVAMVTARATIARQLARMP